MRNREIERKFIITSELPELKYMNYMDITQGYIHDISNELIFRLRQVLYMSKDGEMLGETYFQTIKGTSGIDKPKYESQIWRNTFSAFWNLCEKTSVHKFRYILPRKDSDKKVVHLDVYKNELSGLYTVDVEFQTNKEATEYVPEAWFGPEVTNNQLYSNVNLAYHGKPQ